MGGSPGSALFGDAGARTTNSKPAAVRISRRRGELDARTSTAASATFAPSRAPARRLRRGAANYRRRRHFLRPRIQPRENQFLAHLLELGRSRLDARRHDVRFGDFLRGGQIFPQVILDAIVHQAFGGMRQQEQNLIAREPWRAADKPAKASAAWPTSNPFPASSTCASSFCHWSTSRRLKPMFLMNAARSLAGIFSVKKVQEQAHALQMNVDAERNQSAGLFAAFASPA